MTTELVTIDNLAFGGDGAARLEDGRVVFVPRSIPGEVIEIEVTKSKKSWARAKIVRIVEPSPDREESACKHFERCGGCQFWHMSYEAELRHKTAAARESIERLSGSEIPEPKVVGAPEYEGYRNRATLHVKGGKLGFFAPGSKQLVDVPTCPVLDPRLDRAVTALRPTVKKVKSADLFVETAGPDEVVFTLETGASATEVRGITQQIAKVADANKSIRGAVIEGKRREDRLVVGEPAPDASEAILGGPGHFVVPAGRFRQGNQAMNFKLVNAVADMVEDIGAKNVLELFAGMGNLTGGIAQHAEHVDAFEFDPDAVQTGRSILNAMGHMNVRLKRANLANNPIPNGEVESHDIVVLDPPRSGAPEVCAALATVGPEHVIYVACDAACLGRDAATLIEAGYVLEEVQMLDMFPRTAHIETIARFRRAD